MALSRACRQGAGTDPPKAESDAADPSAVLPRRGKTSAPARDKARQDPRRPYEEGPIEYYLCNKKVCQGEGSMLEYFLLKKGGK